MALPNTGRVTTAMRPLLHDTSYNCAPHCDIKVKCKPRAKPNTDCLGNEETTSAVLGKADPRQNKVHFGHGASGAGQGDGKGRRKRANLRSGMRWASTGNLRGVVG
ncbi:MAG: hypothetical protein Q9182_005466 [Xanthomendoza sp. 2 TL-2023]